jgi:hypothetical protein
VNELFCGIYFEYERFYDDDKLNRALLTDNISLNELDEYVRACGGVT